MDASLREWVRQRADDRCEYCRLRQAHDSYEWQMNAEERLELRAVLLELGELD